MEDREALLTASEDTELILNNNSLNIILNNLLVTSFQAFCNSIPKDKKKREMSYLHCGALVYIVSTLKQRVSVKDEIMNRIVEKNQKGGAQDHEKRPRHAF